MFDQNSNSQSLCLWCGQPLAQGQSVTNFILKKSICVVCEQKIELHKKEMMLQDLKVHYLITYNENIEELLYRYKEQKDEACGTLFFDNYIHWIQRKFQGYKIVYLPSSDTKVKERGFHHLEKMFAKVQLEKIHCLSKISSVSQKHQSKENRSDILNHFAIDVTMLVSTDKVLLVDDVCTTGGSLLGAHTLISPHVTNVTALVFAMHPLLIQRGKYYEKRLCLHFKALLCIIKK